MMHPWVRDLYRRAIVIGRDYPHSEGLTYVRRVWKEALRNPTNCPSWYNNENSTEEEKERELRKAIAKGRYALREMISLIQLKKYRALKRMYNSHDDEKMNERQENEDTNRLLNTVQDWSDKTRNT